MKHQFWNWVNNESGERTLFLEGVIAEESWYEDDVTPAAFKAELNAGKGPITLHINSPGGDVIAASQIYTLLMDYPYNIRVQIDGIAASAASVIAMAGNKVCMSPTSLLMIHNPLTFALGDSEEMRKAIQLLDEVKESIITAYEIKTGLSRARISQMMDAETWMNAKKAKELGFCDEVLYLTTGEEKNPVKNSFMFSRRAVTNSLVDKLNAHEAVAPVDAVFSASALATGSISISNDGSFGVFLTSEITDTCTLPLLPNVESDKTRVNAADLEKRLARFQYQ